MLGIGRCHVVSGSLDEWYQDIKMVTFPLENDIIYVMKMGFYADILIGDVCSFGQDKGVISFEEA